MTPAHEQFLNITAGHSLRRLSIRSSQTAIAEVVTYTYQQLDPDMKVVAVWEVEESVGDMPPHVQSWRGRRLDLPGGPSVHWLTDADSFVGDKG